MTVIAGKVEADRIVIGSDSQISWGWQAKSGIDDSKLVVLRDFVIGAAGWLSHINYMQMFAENHRPLSSRKRDVMEFFVEFNEWADKKIKGFEPYNQWLLAYDGKLISVGSDLSISYHEFWAVGSGAEYARTAMHLGHDVRSALLVACELTVYCSEPLHVHELPLSAEQAQTATEEAEDVAPLPEPREKKEKPDKKKGGKTKKR
jgi:ATP-dependent protease HslVU (ClpYQ) peptidase subunit